ncbi:MAG: hypothetical protein P1P82_14905 [Bacteroidales bacterium]|nr:hypothetical protein [Bacteroidales bacterium]
MEKEQIQQLLETCRFDDSCEDARLIETHISWVVLTDHFAYKFKRPVKYSFVDFSTRELREHYCHLEVELNRRLAPDMYLGVVAVTADGVKEDADPGSEEVIGHAVKMKRMDNRRRMDRLLKLRSVHDEDIDKLAKMLAAFHENTRIVKNAFNTTAFHEKYSDILSVKDYTREYCGTGYLERTRECVTQSYLFLNLNRNLMNHRVITDHQRDCHGDLNCTNIFLYDEPVIFDCIDFNKEYRVMDVLSEIAFLCVELDFHGYAQLGHDFYNTYMQAAGEEVNGQTGMLFNYYKSYRANVRAKVTAINAVSNKKEKQSAADVKSYLDLMNIYIGKLNLKPVKGRQIPGSIVSEASG